MSPEPIASDLQTLVPAALKILFVFAVLMLAYAPLLGWLERKQSAVMQDRIGANRADIFGFTLAGLFHPLADGIKVLFKEDFIPEGAHRVLHGLAPLLAFVPPLILFSVIPFGDRLIIDGRPIPLVIADLDVGILFVFAIASLATYGTVLAGWASNNNYSFLGGLRASAQMISYEVAMGLTIVGVLLAFESIRLTEITEAQGELLRLFRVGGVDISIPKWGIFLQPVGFFMFFLAGIAESKRIPFDLPEGESELVAGYFLEYSGFKFLLFWLAEFIETVVLAGVVTALFFGGWQIP
ncbi:MAG: complex I subunit 1/NuoH family protein, partial [Vicinamibacteria bacterium]